MNNPSQSKINFTALVVLVINLAAALGWIPQAAEVPVIAIVNTVGPGLIYTFRTHFTAPRAPSPGRLARLGTVIMTTSVASAVLLACYVALVLP